jgi:twitching motility protein PilT
MYSAIQTGVKDGMQTLDQNLQELVRARQITPESARTRAVNKDLFNVGSAPAAATPR